MKEFDMLRRDFLRWMALSGGSLGLASLLPRPARAAAAAATNKPLFVAIEAVGAYDVTLMCNPMGNGGQTNPPNTGYTPSQILTTGALQVAPQIPSVVDFFRAYSKNTLVINGIDTSTIDHATGMRSSMSGIGVTGYPVTAALVASVIGSSYPASFMCNGGANDTENIIGLTQLGGGISDALENPMNGGSIHSSADWTAISAAISRRLAREAGNANATLKHQRLTLLQQAFVGADGLSALTATVNDASANVPLASPNSSNLVADAGTALNIQVGLAGYLHGQTAALQIAVGIFDTHSTNDASQASNYNQLMSTVDYLLRCAAYLNLSNSLLVYVGSDFSRTPYYNSNNAGKDHWPTTSALVINPSDSPNTPVNTTIGAADAGLNPLAVDPGTLKVDTSGVNIQPGHVHDALRRYMGIDQAPVCMQFGLQMSEQLPLLG